MTTSSTGRCVIDSVEVGEVHLDMFRPQGPVLECKFAYVSSEAGTRMGFNHKNAQWSPETMAKLHDLLQSMERDICSDVFIESTTMGGESDTPDSPSDGVPSL